MPKRTPGAAPGALSPGRALPPPPLLLVSLLLALGGCGENGEGASAPGGDEGGAGEGGGSGADGGTPGDDTGDGIGDGDGDAEDPDPEADHPQGWFGDNTISHRVELPLTAQGAILNAEQLALQLEGYDPGSLLRCGLSDDAAYRAAVDGLGGVTWGYGVRLLEDLSKPHFLAGLSRPPRFFAEPGLTDGGNMGAVEIVKPDIVAVTESAALFYSRSHGLMLVDLTGSEPAFECATQLPGVVDQFFFRDGHLVAMAKQQPAAGGESFLMHFDVGAGPGAGAGANTIRFVETVKLGEVNILDSRRFNDKLVFYTDLRLVSEASAEAGLVAPLPVVPFDSGSHRSLRVFTLGETLVEELRDTLIDTTVSADELINSGLLPDTPVGSVINESRRFGNNMWASDKYFAVTENISETRFAGFETRNYSVCTESHVVETSYTHCTTVYETRPNPDYTPPDNSSGDRACQNITLSTCLRQVARASNETIQVPVDRQCDERKRQRWVCDRYEARTTEYPTFSYAQRTQLYIYEYAPSGFVRLDANVREITNPGLSALQLDDSVAVLTTSAETFDLAVPGAVQTLYFQDGILYVISQGVLQVYTLSGSSLVRTATLQVVNDSLQSTLFSQDMLYLSDFGYRGGMDESVLRVVNLSNPAFPSIDGATHSLPGGHSSILASRYGILTIGAVARFDGESINAVKLGLFSDPFVAEEAYLILATGLDNTWLREPEAQYFSGAQQRLLLPYMGQDAQSPAEHRVSVSRVAPGEIVSEGAVQVPEPVQRVRPIGAAQDTFLTFAENSIEWLTPRAAQWQSQPVLEYYQPFALLRLNEQDDYVEVQRLGERCKIFLANASDINQRAGGIGSEVFDCAGGAVRAYDRTLLLTGNAVEFDGDGGLRELSAAERATIEASIANRETCLLSTDFVDVVTIDYSSSPERSDFTCVGPEELQRLIQAANEASTSSGSAP